ncbi:MAG: hypothetical protein HPY69_03165 [Armatimonadetes bacterium]|nr:hypothetical protein [Armatimonadota bacterium]
MSKAFGLVVLVLVAGMVLGLCGCGGMTETGGMVDTAAKPPPPPPPSPNTPDWIAFQRYVGTSKKAGDQIFIMGSDGSGLRQLTNFDAHGLNITPSWNGSRTRIVFRSLRTVAGIYSMAQDGTDQQLERPGVYGRFPDWCPAAAKASWVALHQDSVPGSPDDGIYVVDTSGGASVGTKVAGTQPEDMFPTWSPDGNLIAFYSSGRPEPGGLFVIPVMGGTATYVGVQGAYPDWSPDGTRIAYSRAGNVYYVTVDPATGVKTGAEQLVTESSVDGYGEHPTWSPDGSYLTCRLGTNVAKVNVSTGAVTPLFATGDAYSWPDWSLMP